ncbi:MAG: hypothetical protein IJE00_06935 [Clostridia bacterium]|nr:hypothetical protein [Clostridia bacterium]
MAFVGFLIGAFLLVCESWFLIREILWSIVWCEQGGKYRNIRQLKEKATLWNRIRMRYLQQYVSQYKKAFTFWHLFLRMFTICESIFIFLYIVLLLFFFDFTIARVIMLVLFGQAFLLFLFIAFQFDINRNTKYDRLRKK